MLGSTLDYIQSGTLLLCGGEGFSPDDAYGSTLDSVMPMKGKHTINYLQYHEYGFGRTQSRTGSTVGFSCSQLQLRSPP